MSSQLQEQLERLYKLQLNVILQSDWDNQWTVGLGNQLSPPSSNEEESGLTLDEVADWLSKQHVASKHLINHRG